MSIQPNDPADQAAAAWRDLLPSYFPKGSRIALWDHAETEAFLETGPSDAEIQAWLRARNDRAEEDRQALASIEVEGCPACGHRGGILGGPLDQHQSWCPFLDLPL